MTSNVKKYSILIIAAVLLVAMAFAGAASAVYDAPGGEVGQYDETTTQGQLAVVNDLRKALGMAKVGSVTDTVVKLDEDVYLKGQILFNNGAASNLVLDLNGFNITSDGENHGFATIGSPAGDAIGNFTITDSSLDKTGNISGFNSSSYNGGCVYVFQGQLTMTGGNITNCTAYQYDGGGVYVDSNGRFNMTGGNITDCHAYEGSGGGVNNYGTFNMSGNAEISYCTATCDENEYEGLGGGVYSNGEFNMTDHAKISNCDAEWGGGGVLNEDGTFNMSGNAEISYCTAEYYAGGVENYYKYKPATFEMSGDAVISHCTVSEEDGYGGGVDNYEGTFNMTGGTISGCTADVGAGVYNNGEFNISGSAMIDSDVALLSEDGEEMLGNAKDAALVGVQAEKSLDILKDAALAEFQAAESMDVLKDAAMMKGDDKVLLTAKSDTQSNEKLVFYPITLDNPESFTGSVKKIRLYYYDEDEEDDVENPSLWVGEIIVKNGGTASDKFALSTNSDYSGYTLKTSGSNLTLAKKETPTPAPSPKKQTGATVILQQGQVAPTQATPTPTATPTAKPTAEPTVQPIEKPTQNPSANPTTQPTQKSPAPFVGIIAGLGAAALFLRLRK